MSTRSFALSILVALLAACGGETVSRRPDGLDPRVLPEEVRADYQVFADRCSKCHSLSRPLNSGIDNDEYWTIYVERMRRQPSSGISREDTIPIRRFLHYYVLQQRDAKERRSGAPAATSDAARGRSDDAAAPPEGGL